MNKFDKIFLFIQHRANEISAYNNQSIKLFPNLSSEDRSCKENVPDFPTGVKQCRFMHSQTVCTKNIFGQADGVSVRI
jgi:hypothetical protein